MFIDTYYGRNTGHGTYIPWGYSFQIPNIHLPIFCVYLVGTHDARTHIYQVLRKHGRRPKSLERTRQVESTSWINKWPAADENWSPPRTDLILNRLYVQQSYINLPAFLLLIQQSSNLTHFQTKKDAEVENLSIFISPKSDDGHIKNLVIVKSIGTF